LEEVYPGNFIFPAPTSSSKYIGNVLLPFTRRWDLPLSKLAAHDKMLVKQFKIRDICALLFEIHCKYSDDEIYIDNQIKKMLEVKYTAAVCYNKKFISFNKIINAFYFTLELRGLLFDMKNVSVTGFGLDSGDIISVPGTAIQIGDCINTASKLGEDIAKHGEINVTDKVFKVLKDHCLLEEFSTKKKTDEMSGVKFKFTSITFINPGRIPSVFTTTCSQMNLEEQGNARIRSLNRKKVNGSGCAHFQEHEEVMYGIGGSNIDDESDDFETEVKKKAKRSCICM